MNEKPFPRRDAEFAEKMTCSLRLSAFSACGAVNFGFSQKFEEIKVDHCA
jgi:hypothetical protein